MANARLPSWLRMALELVREARSQRGFLVCALAIPLLTCVVGYAVRLRIVDGVVTSGFALGSSFYDALQPADQLLEPTLEASFWALYVGGTLFAALASSHVLPALLSPGRASLLLALPLSRGELLLGVYVGVLMVAAAGALYTAALLTLMLGLRAGVWASDLLAGALAAWLALAAVYGPMLAAAARVQSALISLVTGWALFFVSTVLTSHELTWLAGRGLGPLLSDALAACVPHLYLLGQLRSVFRGESALSSDLAHAMLATAACGGAGVALAIWNLERRDV